jgi:hypothetical protein
MDSGLLSPVCDRRLVGSLDVDGRLLVRWGENLANLALVLGTGARVESGGGGGLLRRPLPSPSSTGAGVVVVCNSDQPCLSDWSDWPFALITISYLCLMLLCMCCFLIFDKVRLDWGWIGLMARSGPSYLLSDRTLQQGSLHVGVMGRTFVRPIARVLFTPVRADVLPEYSDRGCYGRWSRRGRRSRGSPAQGSA